MTSNVKKQAIDQVNKGLAQAKSSASEMKGAFQSKDKDVIKSSILKNLPFVIFCSVLLLAVISFAFSGKSAPSAAEVEKLLLTGIEDDSTYGAISSLGMSATFENVQVSDCKTLDREHPSYNCLIKATIVVDAGAMGDLFGAFSGKKKSDNSDNKQREPWSERGEFSYIDGNWVLID